MNFFALHPSWNNFSAMTREGAAAQGARTKMERAHHMTAALYFGVAALEGFINEQMRAHMSSKNEPEQAILKVLGDRKTSIITKIATWPMLLGVAWSPDVGLQT